MGERLTDEEVCFPDPFGVASAGDEVVKPTDEVRGALVTLLGALRRLGDAGEFVASGGDFLRAVHVVGLAPDAVAANGAGVPDLGDPSGEGADKECGER
jgi:hypothetical protein